MTLIELIVAAAVMGLLMTMVAQGVVIAYRSQVTMTEKATNYRQAAAAMELLARDLKECDQLCYPTIGVWGFNNDFVPDLAKAGPFLFLRPALGYGKVAVSWWFDPDKHEVRRQVYQYDASTFALPIPPLTPLAQGERPEGRRMMYNVEAFDIIHLDTPSPRFARAVARITGVAQPLVAEVSVCNW